MQHLAMRLWCWDVTFHLLRLLFQMASGECDGEDSWFGVLLLKILDGNQLHQMRYPMSVYFETAGSVG